MPRDFHGAKRPVRVVIVDDTRSIRAVIRALLSESEQIEVVGEAADPYEARELIRAVAPDVVTLDVEMPRMNGLAFLERIMRLRPMPVVMVSARTTENSREAIKALALGAVECVDRAMLLAKDDPVDLVATILMAAEATLVAFLVGSAQSHPSLNLWRLFHGMGALSSWAVRPAALMPC